MAATTREKNIALGDPRPCGSYFSRYEITSTTNPYDVNEDIKLKLENEKDVIIIIFKNSWKCEIANSVERNY